MGDMAAKREEFMHWLREIKSINIDTLTRPQEKKIFEEYIEEYNTCSFPSKKYYILREWELKQLRKGKNITAVKNNDALAFLNDEANLLFFFLIFLHCLKILIIFLEKKEKKRILSIKTTKFLQLYIN